MTVIKLNSVLNGDCLEVMKSFPSDFIDTIITDPPYGINFRGNKWDYQVPSCDHFKQMLRVANPGAVMLCFGGARTFHRMAINIEHAGWEIKDMIMWLYGSGMPKGVNISKHMAKRMKLPEKSRQWEGWNSALKPAYEPIILAMKPTRLSFAKNALTYGVAGLNIDEARVPTKARSFHNKRSVCDSIFGESFGPMYYDGSKGRYPSNVVIDEKAASTLNQQVKDISRFFYCTKASSQERSKEFGNSDDSGLLEKNIHPTVKPIKLMEYLCKLTKNPFGGIVLDPFAGSGTTGVAALKTKRPFILIEREAQYCKIIKTRLRMYKNNSRSE